MKKVGLIILAVVVLAGVYAWVSYNSLVSLNESADAQWAKVETQYQRRFDLIPNLVNSVKGVMTQEQAVFGKLADARAKYSGAQTPNEKAAAAGEVESALGRLLAVVENYPTLNSSNNVRDLMSQLEGTENRISVERGRFNDIVRDYNVMIKRFPKSLFASMFGFKERSYFQSQEGTENAPSVNF
jgi:LemA protein